ncbi:MAG TPA: PKD domain-containing protein [Thermoanaerobaculaceae bacterium]|nr:PKD domain-containing protein [Thermoanaerobaculaceae bacterium]
MREIERIAQIKEDTMKRFNRLFFRSLVVLFLCFAGAPSALADTVTITAQPNPVTVGATIVLTITPALTGRTEDYSFLDFGDHSDRIRIGYDFDMGWFFPCGIHQPSVTKCETFSHIYATPGTYTVSYVAMIGVQHGGGGGTPLSATLQVTVESSNIEVGGLFVPTAAHLTGHNNVNWRTDLELQNPGSTPATYSIALLAQGQDNTAPARVDLTLDPGKSIRYTDILQTLFGFSGAGALCIVPTEGTVVATSRTYAQSLSGTYGSFVPAVARDNAIGLGQDGRLIGLSHDPSLAAGFRTNVGLVNANEYPLTVEADFYLADGTLLGTASYELKPFEFRKIDRAFEQFTRERVEDGYAVVRITFGAGGQPVEGAAKLFGYASVIDNITGDPSYVPAIRIAQPEGDIGGYWSGTANTNAPDDCSAATRASASFTQDGVSVTGTVSYGSSADCGVNSYTFDGTLLGNALFGNLRHGPSTGTLKGTLSGDSLELAAGSLVCCPTNPWFRFVMHLHR